jgi:hypothetical protein
LAICIATAVTACGEVNFAARIFHGVLMLLVFLLPSQIAVLVLGLHHCIYCLLTLLLLHLALVSLSPANYQLL